MATISPAEMTDRVGTETVSDWVEISQAMIDQFAAATGDDQFIHVDPARAAMTPFGGTIAHGFLMLSLMPVLASRVPEAPMVEGTLMGINYGGNAVRFLTPVRSGSTVRGRFKLLSFNEKSPGRWLQTMEFTVEIQGTDKPALVAEWMTLIVV